MPCRTPCRAWPALLVLILALTLPAAASAADSWFKTDPHVHSVVSGDGLPDLGIISHAGKAHGYNAMFITDHQAGSNFPIGAVIANHVVFDDDLGAKWLPDFAGTPSTRAAGLVDTPVRSGVKSLHVQATSAGAFGESFVRLKRGPNLRSGDLMLRFSAYPTRIDPASGLYVSVSLGGDPSEGILDGYTTQDGTINRGKHSIFVWQLGAARTASTTPDERVVTNSLPYTLNTWNDYEINLTTGAVKRNGTVVRSSGGGLASLPAAERPLDYNALQIMKMSAAASAGGSAEGYFDKYNLDATAPIQGGSEFAFRNTVLNPYDTADFKLYPSIEMGFNRHSQRFNFDIKDASEYNDFFQCDSFGDHCGITKGINGILPTQQTGYLAQLNHPNVPGGVDAAEVAADDYRAFGADVMEVREDVTDGVPTSTMIDVWDDVLKRGRVLVGSWSSDMHKIESLDVGYRGAATYIRAPSLDFDQLMRSFYEGRAYMGRNTFDGRVAFNLDPASSEPYPARYPVHVSDTRTSASVHLGISGAIPAGSQVVWIVNDAVLATDSPAGASYDAVKSVPLGGAWTYVRAELRGSDGARIAMTEPISFSDVAGLPADALFSVEGVTTSGGRGYTRIATKGITGASWNATGKSLALSLSDPPGAVARVTMETGALVPATIHLEGIAVPQVASAAALDSSTGSAWFYDATAHRLRAKLVHPAEAAQALVQFQGTADTQKPSAPATLTATAAGPTRIDLAWAASTDNRGVAGYRVRRGPCGAGSVVATVGGGTTSYSDTVAAGATVSYQVEAFDSAGNTSGLSPCASATTPTKTSTTFAPVADAYVQADTPATNFGTAAKLRDDASPDTRSYLRFDLSGLQGTVTKATLVLSATSASNVGYDVRRVPDTTWGERLVNYSNAPAVATGPPLGSSLGFAIGGTPSVDVTAAVAGNGPVSLALTTTTSSAFSLASREGGAATAPRLIVETTVSSTPPPPTTATFAPAADSYVGADVPSSNFGGAAKLRADASPDTRGYLRFDVSGLQGSVTRARLVLTATSASSAGYDVRRVSDTTWGETALTYANAPPFASGAPLGSSLGFASGASPSVDVTSAVAGNGPVGFAVTTPGSVALSVASREAGAATAPRLVVETSGG